MSAKKSNAACATMFSKIEEGNFTFIALMNAKKQPEVAIKRGSIKG
jgi:hypothetical protein